MGKTDNTCGTGRELIPRLLWPKVCHHPKPFMLWLIENRLSPPDLGCPGMCFGLTRLSFMPWASFLVGFTALRSLRQSGKERGEERREQINKDTKCLCFWSTGKQLKEKVTVRAQSNDFWATAPSSSFLCKAALLPLSTRISPRVFLRARSQGLMCQKW